MRRYKLPLRAPVAGVALLISAWVLAPRLRAPTLTATATGPAPAVGAHCRRGATQLKPSGSDAAPAASSGRCSKLAAAPAGCLEVTHVCFDQGTAVLHECNYQPSEMGGSAARSLPTWHPSVQANFPSPALDGSNPDYLQMPDLQPSPPLLFRPISAHEPSPDLVQPEWSCDVPVVLQSLWPYNYAHTVANTAGWLYGTLLAAGVSQQLAKRAIVAIRTPWDLGLPQWARNALQPMCEQPITTFADLSSRGANHSRCFARALLCDMEDVGPYNAPWAWPASQHSLSYYRSRWEQVQPNISWHKAGQHSGVAAGSAAGQPIAVAAAAAQGAAGSNNVDMPAEQQRQLSPSARCVLRVLFQTRGGIAVREFTNLEELLSRCAAWQHLDDASGTLHTAECGRWDPVPLPNVMAVAQQADVVVGIHGANLANCFFMRPGSAVVEVVNPDWPRHRFFRGWFSEDATSQVQWYGINLGDRRLTHPSRHEQRQRQAGVKPYQGDYNSMMRDRNVELPWDTLKGILDQIARINGSMLQYRQLAADGGIVTEVALPGPRLLSGLDNLWRRLMWWLQG